MLKPFEPKFRSDLSVCLSDIAEKQVPTKLKPIVTVCAFGCDCVGGLSHQTFFLVHMTLRMSAGGPDLFPQTVCWRPRPVPQDGLMLTCSLRPSVGDPDLLTLTLYLASWYRLMRTRKVPLSGPIAFEQPGSLSM